MGSALTVDARPLAGAATCRRLAAGFASLVALTWSLIVLGALVRANDAGLACPDWPLCFGEVIPRMDLKVGFEWGHRVLAGSVSLVFVGLGVAALRQPGARRVARGPLALAALLLGAQVLLGALTVWQLLASWTVTSHLVTGNLFAATLAWITLGLRDEARGSPPRDGAPPALRRAIGVWVALLALQMVLGGLVASRYAGLACTEFPTCRDGLWIPTTEGAVGLQLLHRAGGLALATTLLATAALARRAAPPLRRAAWLAAGLGLAQVAVGAANVWLRLPVEVTGLHSALAAALVLTTTFALHRSLPRRAR